MLDLGARSGTVLGVLGMGVGSGYCSKYYIWVGVEIGYLGNVWASEMCISVYPLF